MDVTTMNGPRHLDDLEALERAALAAHGEAEPWWRWWMAHHAKVAAIVNALHAHDAGSWRVENERLRKRLSWLVIHGELPPKECGA